MVASTTRKTFSFAISLLVAVISLTAVAQAATVPAVSYLTRYTPSFAGAPGKMVRDAAGNFYVTDFWGKGIVKLDRQGTKIGFIATNGRPTAVTVLPNNKLIVAVTAPQPKIAFYNQLGVAPNVSGEEDTVNVFGSTTYFRPVGITVDGSGNIYVLDSGDSSNSLTNNVAKVKVYNASGTYLGDFGSRNANGTSSVSTVGGEFMQPMGIAYEKAANQIVVADTMNNRLQFFSASGVSSAYVKSFGTSFTDNPDVNSLGDPVEIAFEYTDAGALYRIYVAEKARNEVAVIDGSVSPLAGLRKITAATNQSYATPVAGAEMKFPSGVIFEKTGTNKGVLYTSNAPTSLAANILVLGIDTGTVPALPTVTLSISPSIPATVTSPQVPLLVSGTTSPANSVSCSVNGGAYQNATGTSNWSVALDLNVNAQNYILCKATSGSATSYAEATTYYAGSLQSAPTVSITSPASGFYTKNATVTVSGTSNASYATVRLTNALTNAYVDTTTAADNSWTAVVALNDGSNAITPTIWKAGTDIGTAAAITVVSDSVTPAVTLGFLSNSRVTGSAVQNLDGIVNKAMAYVTSIDVNGIDVPVGSMLSTADNKTYFSVPVTLNRGSNNIVVNAIDKAGRIATATRTTVTLDPDLPAFAVALPADNSYMNVAAPSNGTADSFYTSVNAAGQNSTPASGLWNAPAFTLGAGFNAYEFTASGIGKSATEKRTVINDVAYVKLAITSPAADLATKYSSVLVQGVTAINLNPVPVITVDGGATVNVSSYNPTTGEFSHTVTLVSQGAHTVKVTANTATSVVRNIIYDTVAPEFSIQANSKAAPLSISGAIEPSAKISAITASLLGVPVTIPLDVISYDLYDSATDSVVWHATLSSSTYDKITFTAVDPAGNLTSLDHKSIIPTGDVDEDGSVRLADALSALRHVAGTQTLIDNPFDQADVGALVESRAGRDGKVDITDATLILKKAYGLLNF